MLVGTNDAISVLVFLWERGIQCPCHSSLCTFYIQRKEGEKEKHRCSFLKMACKGGWREVLLSLQQKWVAAVGRIITAKNVHS